MSKKVLHYGGLHGVISMCGALVGLDQLTRRLDEVTCKRCQRTDRYNEDAWHDAKLDALLDMEDG